MKENGIILENINYRYHDEWIFRNFNAVFETAICHCILGPSGIGKSTLLKIIAGLLQPENFSGQLYISPHKQPLHNRISWLTQEDTLVPWLSILDNVLLGYKLRGTLNKDLKDEAISILADLKLEYALNKKTFELSGGMKQKVALARVLMEKRDFVLMDEPFSHIDTIQRMELQTLTAKLMLNKTVILVTHDPMEAIRMGHKIHLISTKPIIIEKTMELAGKPPRDVGDPESLITYHELLHYMSLGNT